MKFGDQPGAGQDDAAATVFRDVVLLALAGFVAIVLLLLPHINPPGTAADSTDEPPGNVIVELFWDDDRDVDLDLWVAIPHEPASEKSFVARCTGGAEVGPRVSCQTNRLKIASIGLCYAESECSYPLLIVRCLSNDERDWRQRIGKSDRCLAASVVREREKMASRLCPM